MWTGAAPGSDIDTAPVGTRPDWKVTGAGECLNSTLDRGPITAEDAGRARETGWQTNEDDHQGRSFLEDVKPYVCE